MGDDDDDDDDGDDDDDDDATPICIASLCHQGLWCPWFYMGRAVSHSQADSWAFKKRTNETKQKKHPFSQRTFHPDLTWHGTPSKCKWEIFLFWRKSSLEKFFNSASKKSILRDCGENSPEAPTKFVFFSSKKLQALLCLNHHKLLAAATRHKAWMRRIPGSGGVGFQSDGLVEVKLQGLAAFLRKKHAQIPPEIEMNWWFFVPHIHYDVVTSEEASNNSWSWLGNSFRADWISTVGFVAILISYDMLEPCFWGTIQEPSTNDLRFFCKSCSHQNLQECGVEEGCDRKFPCNKTYVALVNLQMASPSKGQGQQCQDRFLPKICCIWMYLAQKIKA